jgi:hypothetical protein
VSALPQTFRDAFSICRRLDRDVCFLWIDSLCIQQDDEADWEKEAATMSDGFANSYCTIAATAARNASEGCYFDRDPSTYIPRHLELGWNHGTAKSSLNEGVVPFVMYSEHLDWSDGMKENPLLRRGWVLQERLLAPRTVHFSRSQVFWQCSYLVASEIFTGGQLQLSDYFDSVPKFDAWSLYKNLKAARLLLMAGEKEGSSLLDLAFGDKSYIS